MQTPVWINPEGFHAELLIGKYTSSVPFFRRPLYHATLHASAPMTLVDRYGRHVQPDKRIEFTDFSSVPRPLWWIPGLHSLSYPGAGYLHDSCFRYHGAYFECIGGFIFKPVTFEEANMLLADGVLASGGYIADDVYEWAVSGRIGRRNWERNYDPKLRLKYGYPA